MFNDFNIDNFINNFSKNCTKVQKKVFQKNQVITSYIQKRNQFCILIKGNADLVRYDFNGNKTIVEHFSKNDIFGEVFYTITTNNELLVEAKKQCEVLFYKLNELNLIKAKKKSISDVLIIPMIEDLTVPIEIASELRKSDIKTEIYLNNKKLKAKFKYADKLEIPYVVVIGEDEIEENKYKLKDMKTGNEQLVDISQMIRILKQ